MADRDPDQPRSNGAGPDDGAAGRRDRPIYQGSVGREPEQPAGLPVAGPAAARRPVQHQRRPRRRRGPRSRAADQRHGQVGPGHALPRRPELRRPVRAAQRPRRGAGAVPAGRSAAPAVPVRPPDHRRGGPEHRLPAAAARADRFRPRLSWRSSKLRKASRGADQRQRRWRRPSSAAPRRLGNAR